MDYNILQVIKVGDLFPHHTNSLKTKRERSMIPFTSEDKK